MRKSKYKEEIAKMKSGLALLSNALNLLNAAPCFKARGITFNSYQLAEQITDYFRREFPTHDDT